MLRKFITSAVLGAALLVGAQALPPAPDAGCPIWLGALPAFALDQDLNTPVTLSAVSVTNSATSLLAGVTEYVMPYREAWINPTNGEIAVGDSTVATTTGVLLASGEKLTIGWSRGKNWFGIRTGGSNVDVRVMVVR